MEQETRQVIIDHTASLRLANLAVIVVVWLGWTVYSVMSPLVDLVPSAWGQYFIIIAVIAIMAAVFFYSLSGFGLAVVGAVGFAVIALAVGIVIVESLQSSLATTGLTAAQGQELTNTFSASLGTFAILPIILIAVAGIVIMFLLMNFATGRYTAAIE